MPEQQGRVLSAYFFCESWEDRGLWLQWAVAELIRGAAALPAGLELNGTTFPTRAYCPLCRRGPQSIYAEGFIVPSGLERHLLGSHNSRRCSVFRAADRLSIEHVTDRQDNSHEFTIDRATAPWKCQP